MIEEAEDEVDKDAHSEEERDQNYDGTILPTPDDPTNSCGYDTSHGFIVGGQKAKIGSYPFIAAIGVRIQQQKSVFYVCSGNLINRRYVLTAADCHKRSIPIFEVLLGAHDFKTHQNCRGGDEQNCTEGDM